jgi:electron transport complex protein RnfE
MGAGFALLLCALGAFRELIGHGSIFARLDMLFGGEPLRGLALVDGGFLLAILPPGAFISLALFIAGKNELDRRRQQKNSQLQRRSG